MIRIKLEVTTFGLTPESYCANDLIHLTKLKVMSVVLNTFAVTRKFYVVETIGLEPMTLCL